MMPRGPVAFSGAGKTLQMTKATHAPGRKNHPSKLVAGKIFKLTLTSILSVGFGRRNRTLRRIRLH
jgi:hypothetical protein